MKDVEKLVKALGGSGLKSVKDKNFRSEVERFLPQSHFGLRDPVSCIVDGTKVSFNVKRVGRLLPPYNRALLGSYSAHRARADYEPDFPA